MPFLAVDGVHKRQRSGQKLQGQMLARTLGRERWIQAVIHDWDAQCHQMNAKLVPMARLGPQPIACQLLLVLDELNMGTGVGRADLLPLQHEVIARPHACSSGQGKAEVFFVRGEGLVNFFNLSLSEQCAVGPPMLWLQAKQNQARCVAVDAVHWHQRVKPQALFLSYQDSFLQVLA